MATKITRDNDVMMTVEGEEVQIGNIRKADTELGERYMAFCSLCDDSHSAELRGDVADQLELHFLRHHTSEIV